MITTILALSLMFSGAGADTGTTEPPPPAEAQTPSDWQFGDPKPVTTMWPTLDGGVFVFTLEPDPGESGPDFQKRVQDWTDFWKSWYPPAV